MAKRRFLCKEDATHPTPAELTLETIGGTKNGGERSGKISHNGELEGSARKVTPRPALVHPPLPTESDLVASCVYPAAPRPLLP